MGLCKPSLSHESTKTPLVEGFAVDGACHIIYVNRMRHFRTLFRAGAVLAALSCVSLSHAAEKKEIRRIGGSSDKAFTKPIVRSEPHTLVMVTEFDKSQKTFLVLNRDAKRNLEKDISLERRLMGRAIRDVKKVWANDATTAAQKFPYLSARKLTVRGNYRSAEDAQKKLEEIKGAMSGRKQKKDKGVNSGHGNNQNNNGGKKIGRNERTVKRLGGSSSSRSALKSSSDPVVQQWPVEKQVAVAADMLTARLEELKQLVKEGKSLNTTTTKKSATTKAGDAKAKAAGDKGQKKVADPWAPPAD